MTKQYCLLALAALLFGSAPNADEKNASLAIIVNKQSEMENVAAADLARYFRGEKTRDGAGNKVVILMREHGSPERAAVLKRIYAMTEQEYQTYFLQATYTGQVAAAPKKLITAAAVRQFVADNPGAIGYVKLSDVDDSVKALKIDGKSPGDPGYDLKL